MSEERATAAFDEAGVDYTLVCHGPVSSLVEAAQQCGVHPGQVVKTLVVRRGKDDYLLVLVPGDRQNSWPRCTPSSTSPDCRCQTPRQPAR